MRRDTAVKFSQAQCGIVRTAEHLYKDERLHEPSSASLMLKWLNARQHNNEFTGNVPKRIAGSRW